MKRAKTPKPMSPWGACWTCKVIHVDNGTGGMFFHCPKCKTARPWFSSYRGHWDRIPTYADWERGQMEQTQAWMRTKEVQMVGKVRKLWRG